MVPAAETILTGDDALTERVCAELVAGQTHVCILSALGADRVSAFERIGAVVVNRSPENRDALEEAGVATAATIITLSNDDEANLAVALRARMMNPRIRVVLRQFGTKIGRKIEQNLPDCSVVSPAAHAASTYAGAALDPGCFFALRFPEPDTGLLLGFSASTAEGFGVGGLTVAAAEELLDARIVAVGDQETLPPGKLLVASDPVVIFGRVIERRALAAAADEGTQARAGAIVVNALRSLLHADPILRATLLGGAAFYALLLLFFHFAVRSTWDSAAFDVAQLATNAGFGDA